MTNPSDIHAVRCEAEASALLIIDIQPRLTAAMPVKVLARLQRNLSLLARRRTRWMCQPSSRSNIPASLAALSRRSGNSCRRPRKPTRKAVSPVGYKGFLRRSGGDGQDASHPHGPGSAHRHLADGPGPVQPRLLSLCRGGHGMLPPPGKLRDRPAPVAPGRGAGKRRRVNRVRMGADAAHEKFKEIQPC